MSISMLISIVFLLCILCLSACQTQNKIEDDFVTKEFTCDEFTQEKVVDYAFVPLETSEASLLGRVIKVEKDGDYLFVLHKIGDELSIYEFDTNGRFVAQIGAKGRANNEYLSICDFVVDRTNKRIVILDPYLRVLAYDYSGKHLSTIKIANPEMNSIIPFVKDSELLPDGRLVLWLMPNYNTTNLVCVVDASFEQMEVLAQCALPVKVGAYSFMNAPLSVEVDKILALVPMATKLLVWSNDGECKEVVLSQEVNANLTELESQHSTYEDYHNAALMSFYRDCTRGVYISSDLRVVSTPGGFYLLDEDLTHASFVTNESTEGSVSSLTISSSDIVAVSENSIITLPNSVFWNNLPEIVNNNPELVESTLSYAPDFERGDNPVLVIYNLK